MNYATKIIILSLLVPLSSNASQITVYYQHKADKSKALKIRDYILNEKKIPLKLIQVHFNKECLGKDERFIELCINKKGELITLSSNIQKKIESFKIFSSKGVF